MAKKAKWILIFVVLGSLVLGTMSYFSYAKEIGIASAAFDANQELLRKYGKPKCRLLNRIRNSGGSENWKLELYFLSLRESGLIKVQAYFLKSGDQPYWYTGSSVYSDGKYVPLTSNSSRPSGWDLGFSLAPEYGR